MNYSNLTTIVAVACGILVVFGLLGVLAWRLSKRQPYGAFLSLKTRQKIRFLKALMTDRRIPWVAKVVPVALVGYLAMPFDIIPDFLPVLGYLDDVIFVVLGLALFIHFCPREVVKELLDESSRDSHVSQVL